LYQGSFGLRPEANLIKLLSGFQKSGQAGSSGNSSLKKENSYLNEALSPTWLLIEICG
jgi:hypothetical protein